MKKLPEDLANKLLDASDQMPEGSGFDVSVDEVARMADIPRATLYYYFSGKDDLVEFYLNDLMDRTRAAIQKAAAFEGTTAERLATVMTAVIGAFAEYPKMCLELPGAIKAGQDHAVLMANMDRSVMEPFREVLIEGRGAGELSFTDVEVAADAIMGALHMVSMKALIMNGTLDAQETADAVVPQLINGLLPR
ncbi:MAG: TetR/AcrR family transcriptional regulator [Acidobacteria bacterium]|nr:TetR/AcrR family transcriptional regulator [Acidobacteriota bacterium]